MPRMARLSTEARRAQLLQVGREVFGSQPYEQVSIDGLAAAAGVSKGLLYHYFSDKRSFYLEVLRRVALDVLEVSKISPEGPAPQAIQGAVDGFLTYVVDNQAFYRALVRGGGGEFEALDQVVESVRWMMVERIADRASVALGGQTRALLYGWVGFVEFTVLNWLAKAEMTQAELSALLLGALFQLLRLQ